jgi:hypothetical protein
MNAPTLAVRDTPDVDAELKFGRAPNPTSNT